MHNNQRSHDGLDDVEVKKLCEELVLNGGERRLLFTVNNKTDELSLVSSVACLKRTALGVLGVIGASIVSYGVGLTVGISIGFAVGVSIGFRSSGFGTTLRMI